MSSFNIEPMFDGYGKEMEMYHQQHDEALVEIRRNTEQAHLDLDAKAQVQIEEAEETLKLRTEHCKRKYIENLQVLFEDVEKKARMESTFFKVSFFSCFDDSLVYELFVPGHPERIPMKQTVSIPNLVCSYFYKTFHVSDFRQYGLPCSPSGRYTGPKVHKAESFSDRFLKMAINKKILSYAQIRSSDMATRNQIELMEQGGVPFNVLYEMSNLTDSSPQYLFLAHLAPSPQAETASELSHSFNPSSQSFRLLNEYEHTIVPWLDLHGPNCYIFFFFFQSWHGMKREFPSLKVTNFYKSKQFVPEQIVKHLLKDETFPGVIWTRDQLYKNVDRQIPDVNNHGSPIRFSLDDTE